jgi:hypothetical protein
MNIIDLLNSFLGKTPYQVKEYSTKGHENLAPHCRDDKINPQKIRNPL